MRIAVHVSATIGHLARVVAATLNRRRCPQFALIRDHSLSSRENT
jgi:hypothetical protein